MLSTGIPDDRQHPGEQAAVDTQAAVGRQHDLGEVVLVVGPLVDDVICPAADEGRDRDDDQAVDEHVGALAALAGKAEGEPGAGDDRSDIRNAIPADSSGPTARATGLGVKSIMVGRVYGSLRRETGR